MKTLWKNYGGMFVAACVFSLIAMFFDSLQTSQKELFGTSFFSWLLVMWFAVGAGMVIGENKKKDDQN